VLYPLALDARSEHLALELRGWRTAAGLRLHRPLQLSLEFTPALAQCAPPHPSPLFTIPKPYPPSLLAPAPVGARGGALRVPPPRRRRGVAGA